MTLLKGMGTSQGKVTGKARVVDKEVNDSSFEKGEILVARITNPKMVLMMMKAKGIICDIGGMTSHPSFVSRELGIPCIVGVKNATSLIKTGDSVEMDGKTGEIIIK